MAKDDEMVLVIDRSELFRGDVFSGVRPGGIDDFRERLASKHYWMRRGDAERDETVKQLIPYCVLQRDGEIFLTRRLSTQSESRLHNLYSLGIGGHMNKSGAAGFDDLIRENLWRELDEEVRISASLTIEGLGAINDDSTSVSRCHFGLLFQAWVTGEVAVRETDKMVGNWTALSDVAPGTDIFAGMEDWSRHAVRAMGISR